MSTVIGLLTKDRQLTTVTGQLAAFGCARDQIKVLTHPNQVHALLDKPALAKCGFSKCVGTGALLGMVFFTPAGLAAALVGCLALGCNPLIWLVTLGGLSLIGAGFGAMFGCFFGADRFERAEHVYVEAVGWGHKLVVVTAPTPETEAHARQALQQEQAIAIKTLYDQ